MTIETAPHINDLAHAIRTHADARRDYQVLSRVATEAKRKHSEAARALARSVEEAIANGETLSHVMAWDMTVARLRHWNARDGKCPGCGENNEDRQGRLFNGFVDATEWELCPDCKAGYHGYFVATDIDSGEQVLTHTPLINAK